MARSAVSVAISIVVRFGGSVQQPERLLTMAAPRVLSKGQRTSPQAVQNSLNIIVIQQALIPSVWRSLMQRGE